MTKDILTISRVNQATLPVEHPLVASMDYLQRFLARPHELLGRSGPVCPFIQEAINRDALYLCCYAGVKDPVEIGLLTRMMSEEFLILPPVNGSESVFKALLIVFPDSDLGELRAGMGEFNKRVRSEIDISKLMIGVFGPGDCIPGLHSANFFPFRTTHPMVGIRYKVPQDRLFFEHGKRIQDSVLALDVEGKPVPYRDIVSLKEGGDYYG